MITGVEIQKIYKEIQKQLFYMIPEKWERVYLYASMVEGLKNVQAAEMFFYYYPTGLIKKNPVNVYEVPNKFNIDEEIYLKLADRLYSQIKNLRKYTLESGEDEWSSVTISIENKEFIIEYDYNNIKESEYSNDDRRVIWRYKYLDLPWNSYTRRERRLIQKHEHETREQRPNSRVYIEQIKHKYVNNIIDYNSANYNEKIIKKKEKKFEADINKETLIEEKKKVKNETKIETKKETKKTTKRKKKDIELDFEDENDGIVEGSDSNKSGKSQILG